MHWYWILLIVFGYFCIGAVVAGFAIRLFNEDKISFIDDDDMSALVIFSIILWPMALIFFILLFIVVLVATPHKNKDKKKETKSSVKDI